MSRRYLCTPQHNIKIQPNASNSYAVRATKLSSSLLAGSLLAHCTLLLWIAVVGRFLSLPRLHLVQGAVWVQMLQVTSLSHLVVLPNIIEDDEAVPQWCHGVEGDSIPPEPSPDLLAVR